MSKTTVVIITVLAVISASVHISQLILKDTYTYMEEQCILHEYKKNIGAYKDYVPPKREIIVVDTPPKRKITMDNKELINKLDIYLVNRINQEYGKRYRKDTEVKKVATLDTLREVRDEIARLRRELDHDCW